MAYKKDTTDLSGILLDCLGSQDPMLYMLEWLCEQLMEAEVSTQLGAWKTNKARNEKATAAATVHVVWTPGKSAQTT